MAAAKSITPKKTEPVTALLSDEEFLVTWEPHIRRVCASFKKSYRISRDDAADMAQEIRIKVIGIPEEKRDIAVWCRSVIHNAARDVWRRLKRVESKLSYIEESRSFQKNAVSTLGEEPKEVRQRRQTERLIDSLPDTQQTLVKKYFGFTGVATRDPARLAKSMGMTVEQCAAELQAALEAMREEAKNEAYES